MTQSMRFPSFLLCLLFVQAAVEAQSPVDPDINKKIRQEETDHSQIMHTMHFLTDVYGPRLTGSPNHKAAADWAIKQMTDWGFVNGHLEPWDFGHPGWMNERASGYVLSPIHDQLTFRVVAWTPSTKGTVRGEVFQLLPPDKPTAEKLTAYLDSVKDKVKKKIVLVGKAEVIPVVIDVPPRRLDDKTAAERFDPKNPNAGQFGRPGAGQNQPEPGVLTAAQINEQIDQFLVANGALVRANDSRMGNGHIRAFQNRTYDIAKAVPTVVLRNEDFGRITRIMADGSTVEVEFSIENRLYPEGKTSYNTIAEIPGTDKKDEVIMLGGHLDSWHSATGATDNAIGCAVMMEAARILRALGIKPRRTIRVALWSGEEEGLLGSQAYVKQHFGSFEEPKPEFAKFNGYFNVDSGTGRVRGASVFGPAEDADILRQALAPFADLGVAGAISNKSRRLGGTDSTSFAQAGLPGVGLGQDPIEYFLDTWHTNLDTYERIIEEDAKKSAIVVAAAVYQLAMRDDMLPRFAAADMPPKPAPDQPGAPAAQPARPTTQAEPVKPATAPGAPGGTKQQP
ncbi:MAG TPA: M20/M25/M40 family metallo-hydrolase [Candidatus Angelobacter sp.]|nr:M20/M25/M40 family metallo-hydrolase [Candidatus Angelobacter sp.]